MNGISRVLTGCSLVCFLAALAIGPVFFGGVHTRFACLIQILALSGFAAALLRSLVLGRSVVRHLLDAVLLIGWVYITARYLSSPHEWQSRQEWLMAGSAFAVYFGVRSFDRETWFGPVLLVALCALACGVATYALYQKINGSMGVLWLHSPYLGRVSGTYFCPNHLAGFLEFFIPLALMWVLFTRLPLWAKLLLGYALLVMTAAHLFTLSRGGILSLAGGCAAAFFLGWRHKPGAVALILIAAALGSLGVAQFLKASGDFAVERYASAVHGEWTRLEMWKSALQLWKQAPWFGLGPMQFEWWHASVRGAVPARAVYVHNDYLQTLVDYGTAGAILLALFLLALLAVFVAGCRKFELLRTTYHQPHVVSTFEEGFFRATFAGVVGGLTALLLHSVVDFNLHLLANALCFALLMAAARNLTEEGVEEIDVSPARKAGRAALVFVIFGLVGWQAWLIRVNAAADHHLRRAGQFAHAMDWRAAEDEYKRAVAADPRDSDAWAKYALHLYQRAILEVPRKSAMQRTFLSVSDKALQLNPLNKLLRIRRGDILDRMGRFSEAEKEFADAVAFDPRNAYFLTRLGLHYKRTKQNQKAREMFERASRLPGANGAIDINLRILGPIREEGVP